MEMLTAYLVALSFGAVLLGAGMLFGGGDHDTDHDLDADHDFDTDLSATSHSTGMKVVPSMRKGHSVSGS